MCLPKQNSTSRTTVNGLGKTFLSAIAPRSAKQEGSIEKPCHGSFGPSRFDDEVYLYPKEALILLPLHKSERNVACLSGPGLPRLFCSHSGHGPSAARHAGA